MPVIIFGQRNWIPQVKSSRPLFIIHIRGRFIVRITGTVCCTYLGARAFGKFVILYCSYQGTQTFGRSASKAKDKVLYESFDKRQGSL